MKKLITMLSALTITTSIAPLTIACGKTNELKGETIELSKITPDMIINLKDKFEVADKEGKPIHNDKIAEMLANNLEGLCITKLTGVTLEKIEKWKSSGEKLSDSEGKNIVIYYVLSQAEALNIKVNPDGTDAKKFIATIEIKKWNDIKAKIEAIIEPKSDNKETPTNDTEGTPFEKLYSKFITTLNINSIKSMYDLI